MVLKFGAAVLLVAGLALTGCGREDAVKASWAQYNKAWKDKDLEALKASITVEHAADLASLKNPASLFDSGETYHPGFIMLGQPQFSEDGQEAECIGIAKRNGKSCNGSVGFLLENGAWKVMGESWDPPRK